MERERGVGKDAAPLDVVAAEMVVDLVSVKHLRGVSPANRNPGEEDAFLAQLFPSVPYGRDRSVPRPRLSAVEGASPRELEGKLKRPLRHRQAGPVVVNPRR